MDCICIFLLLHMAPKGGGKNNTPIKRVKDVDLDNLQRKLEIIMKNMEGKSVNL